MAKTSGHALRGARSRTWRNDSGDVRVEAKKIFFVGRQSLPWHYWTSPLVRVELGRRGELEGFAQQSRLSLAEDLHDADVVFVRNCPERTSDRALRAIQGMIAEVDDGTRLVINPPKSFHTFDSKERAFATWEAAGVACPRHWMLPSAARDPLGTAALDLIQGLLEKMPRLLLRTNNETGSNGLHVVDGSTPRPQILRLVLWLRARAGVLKSIRNDTRVIVVEYIDARDGDGYATLGRAFVLLNRVIGYFAAVSDELEFRVSKMVPDAFERFVEANKRLRQLVEDPAIASQLVRAVSSLGNNIGALDFLVRNGKPVFLELNPLWGEVPGPYAFGNQRFQDLLRQTEERWRRELPNVVENLDVAGFYRQMYDHIGQFAQTRFGSHPDDGEESTDSLEQGGAAWTR